ncbi:hypothetical protein BC829DRAFT_416697 [Chytridium lagenaria]|nr:hypothetical protein BC829DRAFT_416697 [Chytridium lagenaria]
MKLKRTLLTALLAVLGTAGIANAQCSNVVIRREWNELSTGQKNAYITAIKALADRPLSYQTSDPNSISFYDFVVTHTNSASWAHANAIFYPYHRGMLAMMERALQTVGWNDGLVYWDWSAVSQNWWDSDIFSYFGSQGTGNDRCLTNGQFTTTGYKVSPDPATGPGQTRGYSGNPTCLRRCGRVGAALTDASVLKGIFEVAADYTSFRGDDARNFHAVGHLTVGGDGCDLGNFYFSPNDPLFYFHHAMVDKIWWKWQSLCPNFRDSYEGFLSDGARASSDQSLFSWPFTAGDVLNTEGGTLCYRYSTSAGDIPHGPNPGCRSTTPSPNPSGGGGGDATTTEGGDPVTTAGPLPTNTAINPAFGGGNDTILVNFGSSGLWFESRTPLFARGLSEEDQVYGETSKITAAPATTITAAPALPATRPVDTRVLAEGYVYYGANGAATQMAAYAHTRHHATTTALPTTTAPYSPSFTTTALPNPDAIYAAPKYAAPLPAVYIDLETNRTIVTCQNRDIVIPEGYVIHKAFSDYVLAIPKDFDPNAVAGPWKHGDPGAPMILRPPRTAEEMAAAAQYDRPANLPPPPPAGDYKDMERIRYPTTISDEYIKGMGMDPYLVRKGEREAKYLIDKCNADPDCVSPSALGTARRAEDLSFNAGLEVYGLGFWGRMGRRW